MADGIEVNRLAQSEPSILEQAQSYARDWWNGLGQDMRAQAEMPQSELLRRFGVSAPQALGGLRAGRANMTAAVPMSIAIPTEATPHLSELEDGVRDALASQQWGKDRPWYLPKDLVGDVAHRYQGVALHGAMAALSARYRQPLPFWGNAGYVGYSLGTGRTQRPQIGKDGIPPLPDAPY